MATYSYGGDVNDPLDRMRMAVGDTTVGPDGEGNEQGLKSDEIYLGLLAQLGDWRLVAAEVADQLAAEFAQRPNTINVPGDIAAGWANRSQLFAAVAKRLRDAVAAEQAANAGAVKSVRPAREDYSDDEAEYRRSGTTRWY